MKNFIKGIYGVNRGWWDSFTSCFIGSLLGIGITFAISDYLDKKNNEQMEKRIQLICMYNIHDFLEHSKSKKEEYLFVDSVFKEIQNYYPDSIKYVPKELVNACYNYIYSFHCTAYDESADNVFNNSIEVWKSVDNVVNISIIGEIFATKRVLNDMTSKMSYAKERIYRNISQKNYLTDFDSYIDGANALLSNKENLSLMLEYRIYCGTYVMTIDLMDQLFSKVKTNLGVTDEDLKLFNHKYVIPDTIRREKVK